MERITPCTTVDAGQREDSSMLAKLHSFSLLGIDAASVEVEVDVSYSPSLKTILVGLPEAAVRESRHRVDRAMVNSGFVRPQDRAVPNLACRHRGGWQEYCHLLDVPLERGELWTG